MAPDVLLVSRGNTGSTLFLRYKLVLQMHQRDIQTLSAPTSAQFYILYISLSICCYMFRRNRHLQGTYNNVVKTHSNKTVLQ
jgi:hypothetical protein